MIRAFAAIEMPDDIRADLARVQGTLPLPRVVPEENLHLTLVFLGDLSEQLLEEVHLAFSAVHAPVFDLTLSGLGIFGHGKPRLVHAGVSESAPLRHLQAKLERVARSAGAEVDRRRFTPHVTLARPAPGGIDLPRLERAVAAGAGFRAGPFTVPGFGLYRSDLRRGGARYEELSHYAFFPS